MNRLNGSITIPVSVGVIKKKVMTIDLGRLLRKQNPNRIPNPTEISNAVFGGEVKMESGEKAWHPGALQVIDHHSQILNIHAMGFAVLARHLKMTPEEFVKLSAEIKENEAYMQQVRDIEVKKSQEQREKDKQEAINSNKD